MGLGAHLEMAALQSGGNTPARAIAQGKFGDSDQMVKIYRGTNGDNRILGSGTSSDYNVIIYGLGGDDTLTGDRLTYARIFGGIGNDVIVGTNLFDKFFYGGSGNDTITIAHSNLPDDISQMYGGGGRDVLTSYQSWEGAEVLFDGGRGADTMTGGDCRDIFVVDNVGDVTIETYVPEFDNVRNPRDEVRSSIDWSLGNHIEDLVLTGVKKLDGTGTLAANRITGNDAGNLLDGLGGNDLLTGAKGNDRLLGGAGKDELFGDGGKDSLAGGAGGDHLRGGADADQFVFTAASDSRPREKDVIEDFKVGLDQIDLSAIDAHAGKAGDQAFRFIGSHEFRQHAGELRFEAGRIMADLDGDGAADFVVQLAAVEELAGSDLIL